MKTAELREKRKKHREELEVVCVSMCVCVCVCVLRRGGGGSLLATLPVRNVYASLPIDCSPSKLTDFSGA